MNWPHFVGISLSSFRRKVSGVWRYMVALPPPNATTFSNILFCNPLVCILTNQYHWQQTISKTIGYMLYKGLWRHKP